VKFENIGSADLETLKALANFSPGLRFGNPGAREHKKSSRNSEGVATGGGNVEGFAGSAEPFGSNYQNQLSVATPLEIVSPAGPCRQFIQIFV